MSPEQIRGDDVDARSDIYSFGSLMFEVLTGQHLFQGTTAVGVLTKHLTTEPDAPSMRAPKMGIDPRVDHLCHKALAKDPGKRWASAAVLAEGSKSSTRRPSSITRRVVAAPRVRSVGAARCQARRERDSNLRLRRSDIDAFERSLHRRRVMTWLLMTVICRRARAPSRG